MKVHLLRSITSPGIVTVTLLALIVRALTATWTGLTTDEANGVVIAITGSWPDMVQHLKEDGNPPLLSTMLRLYASVFGHSDLTMKLFTLTLGTLQIPISYWVLRRFLNRQMSLQVCTMLALCPPLVRYSTLIRAYALISMFSLISSWSCMRVLTGSRGLHWILLYGASTAALVYGHYWGGFVAIGQAVLAGAGLLKKWFDRGAVVRWLAGAALSVALFLPWTPILFYQLRHCMSPWDVAPMPSMLLSEMASYVFVGSYYSFNPFDQFCLFFSTALLLIVVFSPRALVDEQFDGRLWKVLTVSGYAAGLTLTLILPVMRDRYLTPFAPLLSVMFITTFHQMFPRLPAAARALLPVAIWLPMWIPQLMVLASSPETGTPAIVEEIVRDADRKKDLVIISWPIIVPTINFYLPDDVNVISFPDVKRTNINKWDGMIVRVRDERNLAMLLDKLEATLSQGGKIWLIDRCHNVQKRDYKDNSLLRGLSYMESEVCRMDQIRTWLAEHAEQIGTNKLAPGRDFSVFLSVYRPAK